MHRPGHPQARALVRGEVLTIKAVGALLPLVLTTVHATAPLHRGLACEIPSQCRIKGTELDQWIDAQPRGGDGGGRGE